MCYVVCLCFCDLVLLPRVGLVTSITSMRWMTGESNVNCQLPILSEETLFVGALRSTSAYDIMAIEPGSTDPAHRFGST